MTAKLYKLCTDTPQVHADASNFEDGVSKEEVYEQILMQAEGLCHGQRNWVSVAWCIFSDLLLMYRRFGKAIQEYRAARDTNHHSNLSNAAALLWHGYKSLPAPSKEVNWSGKRTMPFVLSSL